MFYRIIASDLTGIVLDLLMIAFSLAALAIQPEAISFLTLFFGLRWLYRDVRRYQENHG